MCAVFWDIEGTKFNCDGCRAGTLGTGNSVAAVVVKLKVFGVSDNKLLPCADVCSVLFTAVLCAVQAIARNIS